MRAWGATGPVGVALLAAMGLAAGNAGAATVTLDRSCYSPGDVVTETGAGFSPNGGVGENLSLVDGGGGITTFQAPDVTADANGGSAASTNPTTSVMPTVPQVSKPPPSRLITRDAVFPLAIRLLHPNSTNFGPPIV